MICQTPRLLVRAWRDDDAERFFELSRDEGFNEHTFTVYRQETVEGARRWIASERHSLEAASLGMGAVVEKETGRIIGMAGLRLYDSPFFERLPVQVTYRFERSAWGKGYGTEVAAALISLGIESMGFERVIASIAPDNVASRRVIEKLGMRYFATDHFTDGRPIDLYETC